MKLHQAIQHPKGSEFFQIPGPFTDETPFSDMDFWKWADLQESRETVKLSNYLSHLGFVLGTDKLEEESYDRLHYAEDTWHRASPRLKGLRKLETLLVPAVNKGFSFSGEFPEKLKGKQWDVTQEVKDSLDKTMIYYITPDNTYFEVVRASSGELFLFAKYQQIIGSRRVAKLEG